MNKVEASRKDVTNSLICAADLPVGAIFEDRDDDGSMSGIGWCMMINTTSHSASKSVLVLRSGNVHPTMDGFYAHAPLTPEEHVKIYGRSTD